jgi:hypothetical protein
VLQPERKKNIMQPECWMVLTSCKLQTVVVKIFSFMLHLVDQPSCAEVLFIQSATTAYHHDMSNRTNICFFEEKALEVTQPNFPYRWARSYGTIWIVLYIPPVLPVWRCKDVCTVKEGIADIMFIGLWELLMEGKSGSTCHPPSLKVFILLKRSCSL